MIFFFKQITTYWLLAVLISGWFLFAQDSQYNEQHEQQNDTITQSIQQHCLLTDDGFIDACPQYRQQLRSFNKLLEATFSTYEETITTKEELTSRIRRMGQNTWTLKKKLFMEKKLTPVGSFLLDYIAFVSTHYLDELAQRTNHVGAIKTFFSKSYYDAAQDGLQLTSIDFFQQQWAIQVGDEQLRMNFSVRNFTNNPYATVEDIYCFYSPSSVDEQEDEIYTLGLPAQTFEANRITNVVGWIDISLGTLTDIPGTKELYCTLVYYEDEQEIMTPFSRFTLRVE